MTTWRIKRIHEEPSGADGHHVLANRLWPHEISRKAAHLDEWCKDVAPSTEARHDFGHDPARFGELKARYCAELAASGATGALAKGLAERPVVTLLYVAHDLNINQAVVLQEVPSDP